METNDSVRILHAVGFEGGLMLATIPIIAYMMKMSFIDALILDFIPNDVYFGLYLYLPMVL